VISQVRHKNLVKLLGCSVDGPESFLIYEYHFNKSLDLFIYGKFNTHFILDSSYHIFFVHDQHGHWFHVELEGKGSKYHSFLTGLVTEVLVLYVTHSN
jgi:hypothetical protein